MIKITAHDGELHLTYEPRYEIEWVVQKFNRNEVAKINKIFHFTKADVVSEKEIDENDLIITFKIGENRDDYWQINRNVLNVEYNVYIHNSYFITEDTFIHSTGKSIFAEIFKIISEDIWIGGENSNAISSDVFKSLINRFPSKNELELYASARVSSVLRDYFSSAKDFEEKHKKYVDRKLQRFTIAIGNPEFTSTNIKDHFNESEYGKYQSILETLEEMLSGINLYTEKQWQNQMIGILLLVYPKYISVLENVMIKDLYAKTNRFLDYLLVDTNGNTDIIEIKKPFADCILAKSKYRDNYVPHGELSGAIMQVEKYIFNMNKWGMQGELELSKKHDNKLPTGLKICITNPKGIVIMGRSDKFSEPQIKDFEIIKRKYNSVIDILSYDDLLQRIKRIIDKFK
jgi:hypothetical protein